MTPKKGDTKVENNVEVEQKAKNLRKDIQTISANLKELGGQKEKHYQQKNDLDKQLNSLISKAKELKDQKAEIDKKIITLKKNREESNKRFNQSLVEINDEKRERRKHNVPSSGPIRKQIKDLEYNMQTEALSFNKEKKIMDQIKKLKVDLNKILAHEEGLKSSRTKFNDARVVKKQADDIHSEIQKLAQESSKIFEDLTKLSKDIANIKAQRNTVQLVLKNLKGQISQMNQKLSKILKDWSGVADKVVLNPARRSISAIHKKTEEVKDKLKSKKKLTTEDILLLQREAMRR
ncbi:hypothetical protein HOD83_03220 [Candidatus Woesearchaeota archaeon]|jgi:uncharacterized coiled-coil DUF342 family protein|nr:hypothetical protein [Candidatus Woesearchaeota archaeon]MBT4114366.1 hypothetical protein [Candidatus Woesearchaeota archaeon]MBT4248569.1 hypothetical protein [Candidatus Woesearchaeota archaeon]